MRASRNLGRRLRAGADHAPMTPAGKPTPRTREDGVGTDSKANVICGGCLCGAVRFDATRPSKFCAHCHCSNCRRAHGAAFVTWVGFEREQFRFVSGEEQVTRYQTDTDAIRSFCNVCGSTMLYESPRWPGDVHIALAHLENEVDQSPSLHVYVDHRADWWEINDSLPQLGGETGVEKK